MTDETKKGPSRRAGGPGGEGVFEKRLGEIKELDGRILELLARRAALLGRETAWRRSRGKPSTDPGLEKQVWGAWEEASRLHGLDTKLLRQLFGVVNFFGRGPMKTARKQSDPFGLAPRQMPVDLDLPAPRSLDAARMWALMAAASGRPLTLNQAVLNDPLVELVKALNQAGARLSWTDDGLEAAAGQAPLTFEDKLLFAGETPFTFFALLAQALRGAGRCKFAGGPELKLMDVGPLNRVLPALGARLISLNPHAPGLPARLECGGDMDGSLDLPDDLPAAFAVALALSAWAYPRGLVLRFRPGSPAAEDLPGAVAVLNACGLSARLEDGRCTVPPGEPKIPARPELPPDPVLCAYLLAMPAFTGGRARLSGPWKAEAPLGGDLGLGLTALGLTLALEDGVLVSTKGAPDGRPDVDFGRRAELFPLALVLGLASERPCRVAAPADLDALGQAAEMLERLGASFEIENGAVLLTPGPLTWSDSYAAPGPYCILALSLIAWLRRGIAVDNPGELTAVWPRFWNLYNALPTGRSAEPARTERTKDEPKKPRRIRVRGNSGA
ncbi:chorismate mutase [Desulfovibrio aminophilus]|uniref:chorismate mutase n=1 Tax=Desulfovibrio aminophilus TaxID=81425 RepID=UPI000418271D|nr:chorismate mutase [Desulfovibrio aminophilus]